MVTVDFLFINRTNFFSKEVTTRLSLNGLPKVEDTCLFNLPNRTVKGKIKYIIEGDVPLIGFEEDSFSSRLEGGFWHDEKFYKSPKEWADSYSNKFNNVLYKFDFAEFEKKVMGDLLSKHYPPRSSCTNIKALKKDK